MFNFKEPFWMDIVFNRNEEFQPFQQPDPEEIFNSQIQGCPESKQIVLPSKWLRTTPNNIYPFDSDSKGDIHGSQFEFDRSNSRHSPIPSLAAPSIHQKLIQDESFVISPPASPSLSKAQSSLIGSFKPTLRQRTLSMNINSKPSLTKNISSSSNTLTVPTTATHNSPSSSRSPRAASRNLENLPDWNSLSSVGVIHRQGLNPPELVVKLVSDDRPYFHLLIPPHPSSLSDYLGIYGRKKRKKPICRMSLDPNNMSKKNNSKYVGKVQSLNDANSAFEVVHDDRTRVAVIHFGSSSKSSQNATSSSIKASGRKFGRSSNKKNEALLALRQIDTSKSQTRDGFNSMARSSSLSYTDVTVQILRSIQDQTSLPEQYSLLSGHIQRFAQPLLTLSLKHPPHRTVLVIQRVDMNHQTNVEHNKYIISFDYPVTTFLAFSIFLAVEWDLVSSVST